MLAYARSKVRRRLSKKNSGVKAKRARANRGTTISFPLTGEMPSVRCGRPVKAESITVPANLLK